MLYLVTAVGHSSIKPGELLKRQQEEKKLKSWVGTLLPTLQNHCQVLKYLLFK